jgi:hypothetical protein
MMEQVNPAGADWFCENPFNGIHYPGVVWMNRNHRLDLPLNLPAGALSRF